MSVYDSLTGRTEADVLIPPETATEIIKLVAQESAALQLCRSVRMSSKVFSQPVLSALAQAYWVGGDTGLKQTTELAWADAELIAEEVAAIVPVPDAVIDDSGFPIWAEVREALAEAVAIKLDQAVLAGTDKPASWPEAIIPAATAAGNTNLADSTADAGGIANDISETFDDVEDDGFGVTGLAAVRRLRAQLRRARDTSGQKLLDVVHDRSAGSARHLRRQRRVPRQRARGRRAVGPRLPRDSPGPALQAARPGGHLQRRGRGDPEPGSARTCRRSG
jgi:HK97 family phage major capsid protein